MAHATHRNRTRRLLREAYRQLKHNLYKPLLQNNTQIAIVIIYQSSEVPAFANIKEKIKELIQKIVEKVSSDKTPQDRQQ